MLLTAFGVLVMGALFVLLVSMCVCSGRLSDQEREQYYREHRRWPEW